MQQKMQEREQENLAQMQKDLNLSKDQMTKIQALHEKKKAEMRADFEKNKQDRMARMEEMKAKREEMDKQMKSILSQDQYTKWQADRKAKMEQRRQEMQGRKNGGDRPHHKPMQTAVEPTK